MRKRKSGAERLGKVMLRSPVTLQLKVETDYTRLESVRRIERNLFMFGLLVIAIPFSIVLYECWRCVAC